MLSLFAANHGAVMPALQPALQLRGGMSIGGVEPEQVATGLNNLAGLKKQQVRRWCAAATTAHAQCHVGRGRHLG